MLFYWLLFFFIVFVAKVLLALAMLYLVLPSDVTCSHCDEPTLLIRTNRVSRAWFALTFGRVQWRWCPRCGSEGLTRRPTPKRQQRFGVPIQSQHTSTRH